MQPQQARADMKFSCTISDLRANGRETAAPTSIAATANPATGLLYYQVGQTIPCKERSKWNTVQNSQGFDHVTSLSLKKNPITRLISASGVTDLQHQFIWPFAAVKSDTPSAVAAFFGRVIQLDPDCIVFSLITSAIRRMMILLSPALRAINVINIKSDETRTIPTNDSR